MLLLLESLAHLGPLGAPSLVEVKSVDFTDDVWGQGKESFHYKAQLMRSWMQSLPLPGWSQSSSLPPEDTLPEFCSGHMLLFNIYYFNTTV